MTEFTGKTVGVVGLGQIGGSICAALRNHSEQYKITGFDIDKNLQKATINHGILHNTAQNIEHLLDTSDIVILATPVESIIDLLQLHQDKLQRKLLVMDTGSLKETIFHKASELKLSNFIGGHPIAGTEKHGSDSWNPDLFTGAPFLFISVSENSSDAFDTFNGLMKILRTKPAPVDPKVHDRLFAVTIGLPHLLALVLRQQFDDFNSGNFDKNQLTGPSYRGITRVADSNPEPVQQMLWLNRKNLDVALKQLINLLQTFGESILHNDISFLNSLLDRSGSTKEEK